MGVATTYSMPFFIKVLPIAVFRSLTLALMLCCAPLATALAAPPQRIALFLPDKGKLQRAAQAIRNGLLAAYYHERAAGRPVPALRFYATDDGSTLDQLYERAQRDGAELVLGPLDKDDVRHLEQRPGLALPTLAFNHGDRAGPQPNNLSQLTLAPEDDIDALIDWARSQNLQRVLVLKGEKDPLGDRAADHFQQRWQAAGGTADVVAVPSQGLLNRLRPLLLSAKGEAQPGREAVFVASPGLSRQVNPVIRFLRGDRLPVLSLSAAYDPAATPVETQDLDGVVLCDLPWLVTERHSPLRQSLQQDSGLNAGQYERLQALGADAFALALIRLQLDEQGMPGQTGRLWRDTKGQLKRQPICARMQNGHPEAVIAVTP